MPVATKTKPDTPVIVAEPTRREIILPELERIRVGNSGVLRAEDVVVEAKKSNSPLHSYFEWNNSKAAHEYRIWQARQIISAMVVMLPSQRRPITAYVSLRSDRMTPAGGYRAMVDVLADPVLRQDLLYEALDDLKTWEKKYRRLAELGEVFAAIALVKKKVSRRSRVK